MLAPQQADAGDEIHPRCSRTLSENTDLSNGILL